MQTMRLLNGIIVTGTAAFDGTATTLEIDIAPLAKVQGMSVMPVGTTGFSYVEQYIINESRVGGGDWVANPTTRKLTVDRKVETGGTCLSGLEIFYMIAGY